MLSSGWQMKIEFRVEPQVLSIIRKSIASALRAAGLSESGIFHVEIAVGEIASNAYEHAYHRTPGPLVIDITFDGDEFVLMIHDHGIALTTIPEIPRTRPEPTGKGGRGLYLVGRLMDDAEIFHPGPSGIGTAIRIVKRLRSD